MKMNSTKYTDAIIPSRIGEEGGEDWNEVVELEKWEEKVDWYLETV